MKIRVNILSITKVKQPGQTVQLDRYRFWGELIAPLINLIKENHVNCWNPAIV